MWYLGHSSYTAPHSFTEDDVNVALCVTVVDCRAPQPSSWHGASSIEMDGTRASFGDLEWVSEQTELCGGVVVSLARNGGAKPALTAVGCKTLNPITPNAWGWWFHSIVLPGINRSAEGIGMYVYFTLQ